MSDVADPLNISAQTNPPRFGPSATGWAEVEHMRHVDLLDYWKRWNRLRSAPKGAFLQPLGYAVLGAGLATWATGEAFGTLWVAGLLGIGIALLVGDYAASEQRTDSVDAICSDFEDFIARWSDPVSSDFEELFKSIKERDQRNRQWWKRNRPKPGSRDPKTGRLQS